MVAFMQSMVESLYSDREERKIFKKATGKYIPYFILFLLFIPILYELLSFQTYTILYLLEKLKYDICLK